MPRYLLEARPSRHTAPAVAEIVERNLMASVTWLCSFVAEQLPSIDPSLMSIVAWSMPGPPWAIPMSIIVRLGRSRRSGTEAVMPGRGASVPRA